MTYTISVANNVLTLNFDGDILTIPIENIVSKRYRDQQKLVNILYREDGGANIKIVVLDYKKSTAPAFATYADFKAWVAANVIETIVYGDIVGAPTDVISTAVYVTHSDLKALETASEYKVGQLYAITDFASAWNTFDGGTMAIKEEQVGIGEILIVRAVSANKLDKLAISQLYPQDIIHYSLDLIDNRDIGFGDGAGTPCANFKGMIYYRKDTVQNVETHYDFRNVKFRRWAVDATEWTDIGFTAKNVIKSAIDGKIYKCILTHTATGIDPSSDAVNWILWLDITADAFVSWTSNKNYFNIGDITTDNLIINDVTAGVDYDDFTTFGDYYKWVKDVELGGINLEFMIDEVGFASILLSQKVFKTTDNLKTCFSNKFGDDNLPMTFGNSNNSIMFGNSNSSMRFGNNNLSMTFGDNNLSMTFGNGNNSLTFGDGNRSMTFGDDNSLMSFGNNNGSMTFGDDNSLMSFGNNNGSMTFGDSNYSMTFGDDNSLMTFGNKNYSLTFGDSNYSMTFGDDNSLMTFGNNNKSMIFGNGNKSTTFGNDTNPENKMITFGANNTMCVFEHRCFKGLAADLDLTAATHIRGAYNTTIYQDAVYGVKLSYMTGGVLTVALVTD